MFNLFLDDLRAGPCNNFDKPDVGFENWVIVRSVETAKFLLSTGRVNDLSLDNDLGYASDGSGKENPSGKDLVLWMVNENVWPKGIITIHSANFGKAQEMKELIDGFRPK